MHYISGLLERLCVHVYVPACLETFSDQLAVDL